MENSRKNTRNMKPKQQKHEPNSNEKQDLTSLGDLPGLNQPQRGFDFQAFDDANGSDQASGGGGRYTNAERFLDEHEREEQDGFRVEVKKPGKKAMPTSSGKKNRRAFGKFGHDQSHPTVEDIEEDIDDFLDELDTAMNSLSEYDADVHEDDDDDDDGDLDDDDVET